MAGHRFLIASFLIGEVTQPFVFWFPAKFCRYLQGRIGLATYGSERAYYTVV
jgi:hypothetical protein